MYGLKLFPEVRSDRGLGDDSGGPDGVSPLLPTKNGIATDQGDDPEALTDDRLVCITVQRAPPAGLEPATRRLTPQRFEIPRCRHAHGG